MYSNCLIEAAKAWIKDPIHIKLDYIPSYLNNGRLHFFWINYKNDFVYHYEALDLRPFWSRPLFQGKLKRMERRIYEGFVLHMLYDRGYSTKKAYSYVKRHRLPISEADIEEYFYYEKED